jgi:hypothetical protein
MRRLPSFICASALLLAAAACSDDDDSRTSDTRASEANASDANPSTSTTVPALGGAVDVTSLPELSALEKGTYFIDPDGDPSTPLKVTYEVDQESWSAWIGAASLSEGAQTSLSITTVTNLVTHGCTDHRPADSAVGPRVDELANALSQLAPFEVTEAPRDVTLLGYQGKYLELTVPDLAVSGEQFTDCQNGELHSWFSENLDGSFHGYDAGPGRTEQFWILDVEGTRLVLSKTFSERTHVETLIDVANMIASMQIHP